MLNPKIFEETDPFPISLPFAHNLVGSPVNQCEYQRTIRGCWEILPYRPLAASWPAHSIPVDNVVLHQPDGLDNLSYVYCLLRILDNQFIKTSIFMTSPKNSARSHPIFFIPFPLPLETRNRCERVNVSTIQIPLLNFDILTVPSILELLNFPLPPPFRNFLRF